jgi:hypothetical protein
MYHLQNKLVLFIQINIFIHFYYLPVVLVAYAIALISTKGNHCHKKWDLTYKIFSFIINTAV